MSCKKFTLALIFGLATLGLLLAEGAAQTLPEPRRNQILNGLKILLLPQPNEANALLQLRIHSGAAFDLQGKDGMMALLGDSFFPDPATREYVTDELGGRLEVTTSYDSINILLAGRASEFERMMEILRNAIINPPLPDDLVTRLRETRIKQAREAGATPAALADRAIAARLFGAFPYGRPITGTPETLARVERADLLLARERFINPNNATLVIAGNVDERRAMRAVRQLLGQWRKSEQVVPQTFRQPEAPDARTLVIDRPGLTMAEVRLGARGLPRAERDQAAAGVLAAIARERWLAALPELDKAKAFARHEAYALSGMFVLGASVPAPSASKALEAARKVAASLATTLPTESEVARAKSEVFADLSKRNGLASPADLWLDAETYKLSAPVDPQRALNGLTAADVQRVAARLFRDATITTAVVGSTSQLGPEFARTQSVEVLTALPSPSLPERPAKRP
jgi:zinc protease